MRRVLILIISIALGFVSIPAIAESYSVYDFEDLHMRMILPDNMMAFTRNIEEDNPNLDIFGLDKDTLISNYVENNIYMEAMSEDLSTNITITMVKSSGIKDYSLMDDNLLLAIADSFETSAGTVGIDVIKKYIYNHAQTNFIVVHMTQQYEYVLDYMIQYSTIFAGNAINITLHSIDGEVDAKDEALIKSVIDDVRFDAGLVERPEKIKSTDSFIYESTEPPITFRVPTNWEQVALSKERKIIKAKFSPRETPTVSIMFGYQDLWADLPAQTKYDLLSNGIFQEDLDITFFSDAELVEYLEVLSESSISEYDIQKVKYNGILYYKFSDSTKVEQMGLTLNLDRIFCITILDGYVYQFQYYTTGDNTYLSDFESLLESIQFN